MAICMLISHSDNNNNDLNRTLIAKFCETRNNRGRDGELSTFTRLNARAFSVYSLCVDMLYPVFYVQPILLISLYILTILRFTFLSCSIISTVFLLMGRRESIECNRAHLALYFASSRILHDNSRNKQNCRSSVQFHLDFASTTK